ncbi:MAG: FHA domain-containing protein [Firmicutes bacterium]|nr:FHA domain-containing protein [Bacillota bacterium]
MTTPRLVLENEGGRSLPLANPTTIGREEGNTLVVRDVGVSARHAIFRREGETWVIEDLGSTNGTWLNRVKLHGCALLREGDLIQMGAQRMRLTGLQPLAEPRPLGTSCSRCGGEVPSRATFCPACGLRLTTTRDRRALHAALVVIGVLALLLSLALGWILRDRSAGRSSMPHQPRPHPQIVDDGAQRQEA